jgi:hypothetical protein
MSNADRTYEGDGPYVNAPDWPWLVTGWTVAALFVVCALVAYSLS